MRTAVTVFVCLSTLVLLPPAALAADANASDVPMEMKWQKPAIPLKINGTGPYMFLLDSGAGPSLIVDQDLAQELKLPKQGTDRVGDPSNPHAVAVDKVMVDTVQVGDLVYEGVESLSWDRPLYSGPDRPRGVVGLGLFGGMLVTFDYPAGRVRFLRGDLPEPDGKEVFACRMVHNVPTIDLDVAGKKFEAHLDTGSTGFISLPMDAAKTLPLASEPVEVARASTVNRQYSVYAAPLKGTVQVANVKLENPTLQFMEGSRPNVGTDFLRNMAVTIDRKNQRLRFVSDGRPVAPAQRPRIGLLTMGVQDGQIPVQGVVPGSLAEKAGIKAGDVIVKINGLPVAPMKAGDVAMAMRATPLRFTVLRDGGEVDVDIPLETASP
jgi:predicted aspartyl protease